MLGQLLSPKTLKRTQAEQTMLKNLQELESELSETTYAERKEQLSSQISMLKQELLKIQGKDYSYILEENIDLQSKISSLENQLNELKATNPTLTFEQGSEEQKIHSQYKLYRLLLGKYKELINDTEKKTVGEVKSLINSDDLTIQSIIEKNKSENFNFEENYLETAEKIFEFITKEISFTPAELEINFWLTPAELVKHKVGDDEDLAVLLCSCLYALGDKKAEVVIVELENYLSHAFVMTEFKDRFIIFDPSQSGTFNSFTGSKKEVLQKYMFQESKIRKFLYKFNRENYEQFLQ